MTVKANKGGLGTIGHHSFNNVGDMVRVMLGGYRGERKQKSLQDKYNDAYFDEKVRKIGGGVVVKNWQPAINAQGCKAYKTLGSFGNINKLGITTSPINDQSGNDFAPLDGSALEAEHYFRPQEGRLTIHTPEYETSKN